MPQGACAGVALCANRAAEQSRVTCACTLRSMRTERTPSLPPTPAPLAAPRTGNHAFAREYNAAVPDSWQIINGQDAGEEATARMSVCALMLLLSTHCTPTAQHLALPLRSAVANQAKFLVLFKRPGKPVLLGRRGDLIVRPSTIEHTAHRTSGTSVKQHML